MSEVKVFVQLSLLLQLTCPESFVQINDHDIFLDIWSDLAEECAVNEVELVLRVSVFDVRKRLVCTQMTA